VPLNSSIKKKLISPLISLKKNVIPEHCPQYCRCCR
jgi:hypothetical protein